MHSLASYLTKQQLILYTKQKVVFAIEGEKKFEYFKKGRLRDIGYVCELFRLILKPKANEGDEEKK